MVEVPRSGRVFLDSEYQLRPPSPKEFMHAVGGYCWVGPAHFERHAMIGTILAVDLGKYNSVLG
jgi:hypothetical protein